MRLVANDRCGRQTKLADQFPSHVVCRWIGNSEYVAREHYLSVTLEHVERAISGSVLPPDAVLPRKASQAKNESSPQVVTVQKETVARENVRPLTMVEGGFERKFATPEPATGSKSSPHREESSDAVDDAIPKNLTWIISVWPTLPAEIQKAILRLVEDFRVSPETN